MKKFFSALLCLLPLVAFAQTDTASQYKEGTHFTVVQGLPPTDKPTLTEMFSIYCSHCYQWEYGPLKDMKSWLKKERIDFQQAHMTFMGSFAKQATTALAITQGTPTYANVKKALFSHLHKKNAGDWRSENDFFETLASAGLTKADYNAKENSLLVDMTLMQWSQYGNYINAVPGFMVNNRYLININSLKSYDELYGLVSYLAKLPAADQKADQ